jgi:hypothetical protein
VWSVAPAAAGGAGSREPDSKGPRSTVCSPLPGRWQPRSENSSTGLCGCGITCISLMYIKCMYSLQSARRAPLTSESLRTTGPLMDGRVTFLKRIWTGEGFSLR